MKKLKGKAMRKTLLASAALIVMGGGAYAEVSVTGSGNFGVKFDGAKSGSEALTFHHEFDIKFEASGTTDGGLTFGGSVGIDDQETTSGTAKDEVEYIEGTGRRHTAIYDKDSVCYVSDDEKSALYMKNTDDMEVVTYTRSKKLEAEFAAVKFYIGPPTASDSNVTINKKTGAMAVTEGDMTEGDMLTPVSDQLKLRAYKNCGNIDFVQRANVTTTTSGTIANNASVHIGFDVHTLTIGDGLDAGDVAAGGVADVGFDGIGVDDVAESLRGKSSVDVVYTGSFGVANVWVSSGGDDNWGVGFNFNVAPVTIGVGFDSMKVASIGLGLEQGPVSGKLLYSTESEKDKKAYGAEIGYTISEGTSVAIVYSQSKDPTGSDGDAVGFGFSHDLGGGATLAAGIGQVNDETKADLGINMKF